MCAHCYLEVFILSGVPDGHITRQTNWIMGYKNQEKFVSYFERKEDCCFRNNGIYVHSYSTFH